MFLVQMYTLIILRIQGINPMLINALNPRKRIVDSLKDLLGSFYHLNTEEE